MINHYILEVNILTKDFSKAIFYLAIGFILSSISNSINKNKILIIFCCLLTLFIVFVLNEIYTFHYLKLIIYGFGGISILVFFLIIPIDYILNNKSRIIIS
jgi:sensor histidine kinase regulating citrate/malate metabolism